MSCDRVKRYQLVAHTKHDLKVHLVWIPKYRKKVLTGQVALRVRDLIRQIAMEHEITILSGKVASDHINVLVAYRPHSGCQPDRAVAERDQFADTPSVSLRTCGRPFGAATCGPGGILPSARGI